MSTLARFDSHHDAILLSALGYVCTYFPATWEDVGGPESGPELDGSPAYTEWRVTFKENVDHVLVVVDGEVVTEFEEPNVDWWAMEAHRNV